MALFGELGQLAAVAVIALGLLELPLSLTNHWVGLIERPSVLCISGWLAALGVLALRTAVSGRADGQANRCIPEPQGATSRAGHALGGCYPA